MIDEAALEQRLVKLERAIEELQQRLARVPDPSNWLAKVVGSISDEQAFLEAMEYGRAMR